MQKPSPFKYHLYTLFLFTKSDIKTTIIPVTLFAIAVSYNGHPHRLFQSIFWIWLHVLQFNLSNQTISPEEDARNKQYRPLPSGRISLEHAMILRWCLVPTCVALSTVYSPETAAVSTLLMILTFLYNELSAHSAHWLIRSVINAAGSASFEAGATLIISSNRCTLHPNARLAIFLSATILATTIQSQDFEDVHGDRAIGRQTLPIIHPRIARYTVLIPVLVWSVVLPFLWGLDKTSALSFIILGAFVGVRYVVYTTVEDDQMSYLWYNVWLAAAHLLPGYHRFMV